MNTWLKLHNGVITFSASIRRKVSGYCFFSPTAKVYAGFTPALAKRTRTNRACYVWNDNACVTFYARVNVPEIHANCTVCEYFWLDSYDFNESFSQLQLTIILRITTWMTYFKKIWYPSNFSYLSFLFLFYFILSWCYIEAYSYLMLCLLCVADCTPIVLRCTTPTAIQKWIPNFEEYFHRILRNVFRLMNKYPMVTFRRLSFRDQISAENGVNGKNCVLIWYNLCWIKWAEYKISMR